MHGRWVEIEFDCLPLRTVGRLDVPVDASPRFAEFVVSVKEAIERHGTLNTYYLHNARCTFHLTNDPTVGELRYAFEGTVLTDPEDRAVRNTDLRVELLGETCDWLNEPIVRWLADTVPRAVRIEFDRYIAAGDLSKAAERIERLRAETEQSGGFLGMYL